MNRYAEQLYGPDNYYATREFKLGDANVTLLRTVNGKLYTLHHDTHTPHPREFQRLQGTKGVLFSLGQGMGYFMHLEGMAGDHWERIAIDHWAPLDRSFEQYRHPLEKAYAPEPRQALRGYGGGARFAPLFWHRLVAALAEKRVTDFDVYDSVTSSAIIPLTEISVARKDEPIDFPDFTRGKWKTRPRIEEAFRKNHKG
ncbi:MAG: hypothetical protein OZ929_23065 [Bryobacterales bacterium]|nr:hypothetical protein [Bryobacterales bacterium]